MPKPNAPQLRALVRLHWGRLPMPEVLRRAQELDPDATREQLIGLAARLRRAGELGEDQAYIPRGRTKFWTLEEEAELRELAGKQSLADLAEHFGVSEVSLRKKASNLGVSIAYVRRPTLPLTAEELALAEELVELVAGAPLRRAWRLEGARVAKAGERMAGESATRSGRRELRYADSRIRIDRRAEPGS